MKKTLAVVAVLVAAGIAAFFMFQNPLGKLIKLAIEEFGPKMTQASVKVSRVEISATDGRGALSGLLVGNPKGFKADYALKAGSVEMEIDVASITGEVVTIRKILIDSPHIIYEKGGGGTNFDAIQHNVEQYLGTDRSKDKGADKKLIIEVFNIRNAKVSYGEMLDMPLPDIELRNIGKDKGGTNSAGVVKAMIGAVNGKLAGSIAKSVTEGVGSAVKSVGDLFK